MTWHPQVPLPPPEQLSYSTPPARNERKLAILVSWLVILGVVAFTAAENWKATHTEKVQRAVTSIEMQMSARALIGYVSLVRNLGREADLKARLPELAKASVSSARTTGQKLMAVAVAGELRGKDAALEKLDELRPEIKNPSPGEDARELQKVAAALRTVYTKSPTDLSNEDRTRLQDHLGWFGKLASVYGLPNSDPDRKEILKQCYRAAGAAFGAEILIAVIMIGGLVLMIVAIVMLATGSLRLAYAPASNTSSAFIEMFALYLLGFVAIGRIARAANVKSDLAIYGLALIWIIGCCLWPLLRGLNFGELRRGLGWVTGKGIVVEAALGLVGYVAFMPILLLAGLLTTQLMKLGHEQAIHPIIFEAANQSRGAIIGLYMLASVFAPVVEETMFRGAFFHHMRRSHRWLLSATVTALIFAAVHPQGWAAIPMLGSIGFAFAGIREWRGNIIASGTAHAFNNAVMTTMLLLILG